MTVKWYRVNKSTGCCAKCAADYNYWKVPVNVVTLKNHTAQSVTVQLVIDQFSSSYSGLYFCRAYNLLHPNAHIQAESITELALTGSEWFYICIPLVHTLCCMRFPSWVTCLHKEDCGALQKTHTRALFIPHRPNKPKPLPLHWTEFLTMWCTCSRCWSKHSVRLDRWWLPFHMQALQPSKNYISKVQQNRRVRNFPNALDKTGYSLPRIQLANSLVSIWRISVSGRHHAGHTHKQRQSNWHHELHCLEQHFPA